MKIRKTASSLGEFAEWAEQVLEAFWDREQDAYEDPWFRGMASDKHKLVPGLYRSDLGRAEFADSNLRSGFKRRGLPLVAERPPRDDWEWYFLMQHYGAPTRLLDWTDSALVALYFALTSVRPEDKESPDLRPVVWALNPWVLNRRDRQPVPPEYLAHYSDYLPPAFEGKVKPKYPIAMDPTFIAQRMLVQHSHFTLHGRDPRGLDEMIQELKLQKALFRVTILFDSEEIDYMIKMLALMGITETTIFPDLAGLARELSREYRVYW